MDYFLDSKTKARVRFFVDGETIYDVPEEIKTNLSLVSAFKQVIKIENHSVNVEVVGKSGLLKGRGMLTVDNIQIGGEYFPWIDKNGQKTIPKEQLEMAMRKYHEAQQFEDNIIMPAPEMPKTEDNQPSNVSGTCFLINNDGIVLTNAHVVAGNRSMTVVQKGQDYNARVIATDNANDLAVLSTELKNISHLNLSSEDPVRLSEITALGFGFGKSFSNDVKATRGIVSSLAGIANNYSQFQIDASIQVGNSGGPIIDKSNSVVGVAVSKLDTEAAYRESGTIAENVNFAIKASTVKQFLSSNDIDFETEILNEKISQLNRVIDNSVLFIHS